MKNNLFVLISFFFIELLSFNVFSKEKHINSCPEYSFNQTLIRLNRLFISSQITDKADNGVVLPRNGRPLYRGIKDDNPQFTDEKIIRAIFGDQSAYIGTWDFDRISRILTGQIPWNSEEKEGLEKSEIYKVISPKIESALNCLTQAKLGRFYLKSEAQILAADIMDSYFLKLSDELLTNLYINFKNSKYLDYSTATLFSGVYQILANQYGRRILVFYDKLDRGIDLNFANFNLHGKWFKYKKDAGEFIVPGYVLPNEVEGFIAKINTDTGIWEGFNPKIPIDYALFKFEFDGKLYIAIYDGAGENCIQKDDSGEYYFCTDNYNKKDLVPLFPSIKPESLAPIIGILSLCSENEQCEQPLNLNKIFRKYSSRKLPDKYVQMIKKITINNQSVNYWPSNTIANNKEQPGK